MFEPIVALFALGILAWLAIFFILAVAIILAEFEKPEFAFFPLVIGAVALWFFHGVNVITFAWANLTLVLVYAVCYILVGILWSMFKWDRYGAENRKKYNIEIERVARWNVNKDPQTPNYPIPKYEQYVPIALQNKRKFMTWIVLWWASMFWYVFSDLITDFVDFVVRRLGKIYDAIAWRHFKDLKVDKDTQVAQAASDSSVKT